MSATSRNYVGQRLAFNSSLCTVRYVGGVKSTEGTWLGVEWDDPHIGKHNGSHKGVEYFKCRSDSSTAASFIRPKRPADKKVGFLDALRNKYQNEDPDVEIVFISGKQAEEIGFDKINKQQAMLGTLRDVILDGQHLAGLKNSPRLSDNPSDVQYAVIEQIQSTCPKIRQLDLGHNLIESLLDVAAICRGLPELYSLTLSENRIHDLQIPPGLDNFVSSALESITDLTLDNCLLTWDEICVLTSRFPHLKVLSAGGNKLTSLPSPLPTPSLETLRLPHNEISSLTSLRSLLHLPKLHSLSLADNPVTDLSSLPILAGITTLDLSSNLLPTLSSINTLPTKFPGLTSLRLSKNPFFVSLAADDAHMLSLARVPTLTTLNFSDIGPKEREDAELYYLSRIAAQLGAAPEDKAPGMLKDHPLWGALCEKYGEPAITRTEGLVRPGTLEARLMRVGVHRGDSHGSGVKRITLSKNMNVYMLKSLVGDAFGILPARFKLVWETGEWDPVGTEKFGKDDDARFEVAEIVGNGERGEGDDVNKGRWVKREVELVEGTASLGFWFEGREANVRLETVDLIQK